MNVVGFEIGNQLIGVMGGDAIMEEVMKTAEPTPKMIPVDVLDKIRAEIEQNAYPIVHGVNNHEKGMTLYGILQVIDEYRKEQE